MSNIAVISAYNPHNSGMLSVDLAADQFFSDRNHDVVFFQSHFIRGSILHNFGRSNVRLLQSTEDLREFDTIIYWGDFINNPIYGGKIYHKLEKKYSLIDNSHDSYERWKNLFLLKNYDRKSQKVISVSNNFLGIKTLINSLPKMEQQELIWLYENQFDAIFPRDSVSTQMLLKVAPNAASGNVKTGIDAAFLFDPHRFIASAAHKRRLKQFSHFFHRTKFKRLPQMIATIAISTKLLPNHSFGWLKIRSDSLAKQTFQRQLQQIRQGHFAISDTYHYCINCLNLGIPVIGLGHRVDQQHGTLGDYKKKTLFQTIGLNDSYLDFETKVLKSPDRQKIVESINELLDSDFRLSHDKILALKSEYSRRIDSEV